MKIESVTSPGGIEAWLVEDRFIPAFSLKFAFEGGSAHDPAGKRGLAFMAGSLLDQGAGWQDVGAFRQRLRDLGLKLRFSVSKDDIGGHLKALDDDWAEAAAILRSVLMEQHLDPVALERARQPRLSWLAGRAADQNYVAEIQMEALAFADHPYAHPLIGTLEGLQAIEVADIDDYHRRVFARDRLKVVAVGAISAGQLGELLDVAFGDLPAGAALAPLPEVMPAQGGRQAVVEMDTPLSAIAFGVCTVAPNHPDYTALYVLNHILGGGGLVSRLYQEVHDNTLAYVVGSMLQPCRQGSIVRGQAVVRRSVVDEVVAVIHREFQKLCDGDISADEIDNAKRVTGSPYAVPLHNNDQLASGLLGYAQAGFAPGRVRGRRSRIEAMTPHQLRRVANRQLNPANLMVAVAGRAQ